MKKILFAIDGEHVSKGGLAFVNELNKTNPVLLVGVMLSAIDYYELLYSIGGIAVPVVPNEKEDMATTEKSVKVFESYCRENNIQYKIHDDSNARSIHALIRESRFADLLVLSTELFYENLGRETQSDYMQQIMHKSECPVVLVPEHYKAPETIILTYDGGNAAAYAIRQFAYLFPEYNTAKTLIVNAGADKKTFPDMLYMEEFAKCYFAQHTFKKVDANPKHYFNTWIADCGPTMLVTGAYGRSLFSEMLSNSFITATIAEHKIPIFIAHK